ncbi:hypothetical protein GY45DRAFT_1318301 [Cubamyces sp. BRFM 1775]|nr:hypothetical protein GY45DRAFT_1318301 [Cubamyces sp. BRFM 1775]
MSLTTTFSADPLGIPGPELSSILSVPSTVPNPSSPSHRVSGGTAGTATGISTTLASSQRTDVDTGTATDTDTNTATNTATTINTASNAHANSATRTTATNTVTAAGTIITSLGDTNSVNATSVQFQAPTHTATNMDTVLTTPNQYTSMLNTTVLDGQTISHTSVVVASPTNKFSDTDGDLGSSKSFSDNRYAIAVVFTVVCLAIVVITAAILTNAIHRRHAKKLGRETAEAVRAPAFADDDYYPNSSFEHVGDRSDADLYSLYSDATHGTSSQPPMTVTDESYHTPGLAPYNYSAAAAYNIGTTRLERGVSPYNAFKGASSAILHPYADMYGGKQHYRAPLGTAPRNATGRGPGPDEDPARR